MRKKNMPVGFGRRGVSGGKYDYKKIEKKWQSAWEKSGIYETQEPKGNPASQRSSGSAAPQPKWYSLFEFPYPSGDGLHVGHIRPYIGMDIISRKRRMEGYNTLFPIGWDAFGLPTENYAIKTGVDPAIVTKKNTDNFRRQMKAIGLSLDWKREINTTDPNYYKWTQWIFLKFFERGFAYKAASAVNWCPKDKTGLANEEVVNGKCERCGTPVEKRMKEQWMLKITAYAEKLLEGLKTVDFLPEIKRQQENWIGRSEGAVIGFNVVSVRNVKNGQILQSSKRSDITSITLIKVFTTRPDTLFGATYLVLAPEHTSIENWKSKIENWREVEEYIKNAKAKSEEERIAEGHGKTGVELEGIKAINPATKEEIPIWVADYVLGNYGTGAIMAVPAHDERDFEFAKKYDLPIKMVVCPHYPAKTCPVLDRAYLGEGHLVDSGKFDGISSQKAKSEITKFVGGEKKIIYKLRDWVFSRQRYWGEPIPLVFCETCKKQAEISKISEGETLNPGWIPIAEKDLPVKLPKLKNYKPREDGASPLALAEKWVKVKCPRCKGAARRETDTMPNWAGSSWYYLAYLFNKKGFEKPVSIENWKLQIENFQHWMPIDWYNGGMEHVTLHLLYSRFWNQFLYDEKLVPVREPYKKRTAHGLVLAEGGAKMSKSKGNVVSPDALVKEFGADALRLYEMFMGPFNQAIAWDPRGILGTARFLERVWKMGQENLKLKTNNLPQKNRELERIVHQTIKKVTEDIEQMRFNTAVSALMILLNEFEKNSSSLISGHWRVFVRLLAPFAPHVAEELWDKLTANNLQQQTAKKGIKKSSVMSYWSSVHCEPWPIFDPELIEEDTVEFLIQVNGKLRDKMTTAKNISQTDAERMAFAREKIKQFVKGKPKKIVFVPGKLINFVI